MTRIGRRLRLAAPIVPAVVLALLAALGSAAPTAALSRWTGGVDLYRSSAFSTQQTWLWCTAADVQIMRNIARGERDHSRASQARYFDYMRAHDRYAMPVSDGTEPSGWAAGLRHYVDARYQMVASTSFDAALRSAVTNLRKTNLPVGLLVARGDHAWVLTGFTATADPARTSRFTVTSVRVTGPLWGLQSRSWGYDMRPDTRLTPAQLRGFFTPWHYARIRMAWEGRWVSIQAIARVVTSAAASPSPHATARATTIPKPSPVPTAAASAPPAPASPPVASPSVASATVAASPDPTTSQAAIAAVVASTAEPSAPPGRMEPAASVATAGPAIGALLAVVLVILLVAATGRAIRRGAGRRAVPR